MRCEPLDLEDIIFSSWSTGGRRRRLRYVVVFYTGGETHMLEVVAADVEDALEVALLVEGVPLSHVTGAAVMEVE